VMHSLLISNGSFLNTDFPGSMMSMNWRINPAGKMVGHYTDTDGKNHGYVLSKGVFTSIDFPGALQTFTRGINAAGDIVGQYQSSDLKQHGFLLSKPEDTEEGD
jgi:hypothetical protein